MQKTVYFTGSLPRKGETPFGGGEVGNSRTIRMLEEAGYKVIPVRKLRSNAEDSRMKNLITYPLRTLVNIVKWFFVLLFGTRKDSVAHVSGFYGSTIFVETMQVFIAKLCGYRLIYELRGGGATQYYDNGSNIYRQQFRYILNKADYLFSQGKENEPLLQSLCNKPIYHYPNCVQQEFYPSVLPIKPKDKVNLLFFGRMEKEKNPMLIVDTAALLQKLFDNITLTMLGNGQQELLHQVKTRMSDKLEEGSYQLLPGCEHEQLREVFADKHFYIFPSIQPHEGQSNAVTEVMSYGIIPIASPQGFNRSTIGDDYLIVDELTSEAYAERIAEIIRKGEIEKYSRFVRQRFMDNYTEQVVFERTRKMYQSII